MCIRDSACAALRQTLQNATQEAQQYQRQVMGYTQRMQEMLRTEVTMANVVNDLQSAQGADTAALSRELIRIRDASQRQMFETQTAEKSLRQSKCTTRTEPNNGTAIQGR